MSKYTVILSYGAESEPTDAGCETFLAHVDTKAAGYGGDDHLEAIKLARKDIRKQNGWNKNTNPDSDFPVLYVFYGYNPCIQSKMDNA